MFIFNHIVKMSAHKNVSSKLAVTWNSWSNNTDSCKYDYQADRLNAFNITHSSQVQTSQLLLNSRTTFHDRYHANTWWAKKTRTVFRLDNFVTVSPRKACSMSKFSKFYREKGYKTRTLVSLNNLCQICSNRHNS